MSISSKNFPKGIIYLFSEFPMKVIITILTIESEELNDLIRYLNYLLKNNSIKNERVDFVCWNFK